MKAIMIKGLELPKVEDTFIDVRIQSNGKALLHCGMGKCSVYDAEEIDVADKSKEGK